MLPEGLQQQVGACGCRRAQRAGPLILERRRLHHLLLCVQDLAAHVQSQQDSSKPVRILPTNTNKDAKDELAHFEALLKSSLQHTSNGKIHVDSGPSHVDSFSFLVQLRGLVRERLAEIKKELASQRDEVQ